MLLDTFTVIAQLINFLLLVWLLKRFLYQPLLRAIDSREQRLRDQQQQAQDEQQRARDQQQQLSAQREELEQSRAQLLDAARRESEQLKQQLSEQARDEIDHKRQTWHAQLCAEQQAEQHRISRRIEQEMLTALRQLLARLADRSLEQQSLRVFVSKLAQLSPQERSALDRALAEASAPPRLVTGSALDDSDRHWLEQQLQEQLGCPSVTFDTDEALLCGVELVTDGHKISWTLAGLLQDLNDRLRRPPEDIAACAAPPREAP